MSHPPHDGLVTLPDGPEWLSAWTGDPLVVAGLLAAATLYGVGAVRLWRHAGAARGVRPAQVAAHGAGLTILAIALASPLDRASDVLFSAHMAQHELLMLVAAPLIVIGRPLAPAVWALPRRWRVATLRGARTPAVRRTWRVISHPVTALVLHAAVRWLWHVPAAFDAALAHEDLHALQHATFFGTAVLFWWTLLHGRYGRLGYGVGLAFVFVTMLHSGLLAAMLSLSDSPLYDHGARTVRLGLDALVDQQRAGLVMWVPAGIVLTGAALAILAAWLGQSARRIGGSPHPSLAGEDAP